jgi:RNA polymerase sigma factor (sigma-70 family)
MSTDPYGSHKSFRAMQSAKKLSLEECSRLFKQYKEHDCKKSYDAIVTGFLPLAFGLSRLFCNRGEHDDLFQIASMTLMDAARTFDITLGNSFTVHATLWIKRALKRHVQCENRLIKVPDTKGLRKCFRRMHDYTDGKFPSKAQIKAITDELGATPEDFHLAYGLYTLIFESTQAESDDSDTLGNRLTDGVSPEDIVIELDEKRHSQQAANKLLDVLNDRERAIVVARCMNDEPVQLRIVGEQMGVSSERVRQLEKIALNKMKMAA